MGIFILFLFVALYATDASASLVERTKIELTKGRVWQPLWLAQLPPSADELERYEGLHAAAASGDV